MLVDRRALRLATLTMRPPPAEVITGMSARISANGTLEAFLSHGVTRDVLSDPGSRDLTAWVDFSEIADAFGAAGLAVEGPVSQARVLSAGGIFEELAIDALAPPDPAREADRRAAAALVQPGGMSESIRVLIGSRGTSFGASLASWTRPA